MHSVITSADIMHVISGSVQAGLEDPKLTLRLDQRATAKSAERVQKLNSPFHSQTFRLKHKN